MTQLGITDPNDLPQHLRTKAHQFKRKEADGAKPQSLQPAPEQSHTPPGEPRRGYGENEYFTTAPTSTFNNSPTFATTAPLNFGGASSIAPIDPGLFESSGAAPTSPMHEMFGEAMESMGGGQAEEALAVTEGNDYME
jgi:histone demethylase JARID1